jgi:hypothetical protein
MKPKFPNKSFIAFFYLSSVINIYAQTRSFNDIFPNINQDIRRAAFESQSYIMASERAGGFQIIGNSLNCGLDPQIVNNVLNRNPGYLVESVSVIPGSPGFVSLLDVYNALGNVQGLSGRLYNSHTRNQEVPLFEDATRVLSEKRTTAIPDPAPARILPGTETVYIRLKDANFGNTYYRAEMTLIQGGLRYTLFNFKSLSYLFVPVIREGKFIAQLYFEPINEGLLIYSIAGADIPELFASRIHINSAISKRLAVITSWAAEGIINRN